MHSGWVRWISYLVLAALVLVTSCRAWTGGAAEAAAFPAAMPASAQPGPGAAGG